MNLATREAYGNTLAELKDNENVVVLEADLGHATKSLKFKEVCPQRFFNMGIAEAVRLPVWQPAGRFRSQAHSVFLRQEERLTRYATPFAIRI